MKAVHKQKQAIRNIRGHPSAYDTTTRFEDGSWQTYIITHCIECGEEYTVHWNTGGSDSRFVDKKMRGLGWHFDAFKPKNCVCPTCVVGKKPPAHPDSDEDDGLTREEELEDMAKQGNSFVPTPPENPAQTAVAQTATYSQRTLTAHQKSRIRDLLDTNFDSEKGRYIDGYTDQRVGNEADVPWALVTEIREFAYGPIKDDPMVVAFKKELEIMKEELQAISNGVDALRARVEAYSGRLVNLEAKAKKL